MTAEDQISRLALSFALVLLAACPNRNPSGRGDDCNTTADCEDGLYCNGAETCARGLCVHAGDPCAGSGNECADVCDEAADTCFDPAGTSCTDDSNPCTGDQCDGTGSCTHPHTTVPCDDGLFCNGTDTCAGGACTHTGDPCVGSGEECADTCDELADSCNDPAATPCTADDNPCTDDACDGAGACAHADNTAPCDDTFFCNGTDTCAGGTCSVHAGDPCIGSGEECADACNESAGNCFDPDTTACTDDGNVCTNDFCDGLGECAHPDNARPCDDDVFCNGADTCSGGECNQHDGDPCLGSGNECADWCNEDADDCFDLGTTACTDDGEICTDDLCDGAGTCAHPNNTVACSDGAFCNGVDVCSNGSCTHPGDPCTGTDVCYEESGGICCTPGVRLECVGGDVREVLDSCDHLGAIADDCEAVNGDCQDATCGCVQGWAGPTCQRCLIYVNQAVTASGAGTTWATAKKTVQEGVDTADAGNCEVWVAQGSYNQAITMRDGVDLYGGFAGTEIAREQRDWETQVTTLDGSGVTGAVITAASNARLDGFTVRDGFSGGMVIDATAPTVANCTFVANGSATSCGVPTAGGGAIRCRNGAAPTFEACTFDGNACDDGGSTNFSGGGAIVVYNATATVTGSTFANNVSEYGGAIYVSGSAAQPSALTLSDCTFTGNDTSGDASAGRGGALYLGSYATVTVAGGGFSDNAATLHGGAIYNGSTTSRIVVTGAAFAGNLADNGGAVYNVSSRVALNGCSFSGNETTAEAGKGYGGAIYNESSSPEVVDCTFQRNVAFYYGGGVYTANNGHATVNRSTFMENRAGVNGGGMYVNASAVIVANSIFSANRAIAATATNGLGGGLFVTGDPAPTVINTVFDGNRARDGGGVYLDTFATSLPSLVNCTWRANAANGASPRGYGGGLFIGTNGPVIDDAIFWGNTADVGGAQIYHAGAGSPSLRSSDIQGGCPAATTCDASCINADPLFVHPPEGTYLTTADATATNQIVVNGAQSQNLLQTGNSIVVSSDGIERVVSSVAGDTVTFAPALSAPAGLGWRVDRYAAGSVPRNVIADIRLQSTSPAVNTGRDDTSLWADLNGSKRTGAHADMGAYEYGSSVTCAPAEIFNVDPAGAYAYRHFYWTGCDNVTRNVAWGFCEDFRGSLAPYNSLVSILSQEENDFVASIAGGSRWIGALGPTPWDWSTGETWSYSNWSGTPSVLAELAYMVSSTGLWISLIPRTTPPYPAYGYVCESP